MSNLGQKLIITGLAVAAAGGVLLLRPMSGDQAINEVDTAGTVTAEVNLPQQLIDAFPNAATDKANLNAERILWGGVAKDGIPALTNPTFDSLTAVSDRSGETNGVLLEIEDEKRFYPFNILVSHEIVNDQIGDVAFAVTFCPLCGSAFVFSADVDGEHKEFGVSGFLFESNLIMYDRTDTPTLWPQALGEGFVGDELGVKLDIIDFQLLTLAQVREAHPEASILSENTGHALSYNQNPYGDYDQTESTLFPISVDDQRHPAKEIFYVIPINDTSVAIKISQLASGTEAINKDLGLTISKNSSGEIFVKDEASETQPGYYEMWFSWAQHHQTDGTVWAIE